MSEQNLSKCPSCGASWSKKIEKCSYCGTHNPNYSSIDSSINNIIDSIVKPIKEEINNSKTVTEEKHDYSNGKMVNKYLYIALAFFCGGFGIHKFYAGKIFSGFIYLIFCWTFIPQVLSVISAILTIFRRADKNGNIRV